MPIDFYPADFIEAEFPELFKWLTERDWTLISPTKYVCVGDLFEIKFFQRVIPGEPILRDQPSLDIPPEVGPDSYSYHAHLRSFNEVTGNQTITFYLGNMSEFFFKFMTMRNTLDFTFKLAKEMGKPTKGTVSVQMVNDSMVVEHLISHIYE